MGRRAGRERMAAKMAKHMIGAAVGLAVGATLSCTSKRSPPPSDTGEVAEVAATTGTIATTTTTTATSTTTTTTGEETAAVPPRRPLRPATIATSGDHVCALLSGGEVACWGAGHGGLVGPGVVENQPRPVTIRGIKGAVAVSVGKQVSCALHDDGEVACWGSFTKTKTKPWRTRLLGDVVQLVVSEYGRAICGLRRDGTVACLGSAGDDKESARLLGVDDGISLSRNGTKLCALRAAKSLECWSTLTTDDGYRPVSVAEGVVEAENAGSVHCYRLGDGTQHCSSYKGYEAVTPVQGPLWRAKAPPELWADTVDHAGTYGLDCIRDRTGVVKCKGSNKVGQLGNGKTGYSPTPVPQFAELDAASIVGLELGGTTSCVLLREGELRCVDHRFGWDDPGVAGVRSLALSSSHACAVVGGGQLRCWGDNYEGQLGVMGEFDGLVQVAGISNAARVGVGVDHSCAARSDGAVFCWGNGDFGELGDGRHVDMEAVDMDTDSIVSAVPLRVADVPSTVYDLALGEDFSCASTKSGLYCWGLIADASGGEDPTYDTATLLSSSDPGVIRAAGNSLCALGAEGVVRCLGDVAVQHVGEVDPLEHTDSPEEDYDYGDDDEDEGEDAEPFAQGGPLWRIAGAPRRVVDIAVGERHACVLAAAGTVQCWGDNQTGELGDGSSRQRHELVQVAGLRGVLEIDAGDGHTCARTASGVSCWGLWTAPQEHRQSKIAVPVLGLSPFLIPGLLGEAEAAPASG